MSSRSPRAGSIAAASATPRPAGAGASSRSPRAGSIAAERTEAQAGSGVSHPAHHERAPLRQMPWNRHVTARRAGSSRSPRAGSIAASSSRRRRRRPHGRGHPAHHERAPLRRDPGADLPVGGVRSSRSPRAGSIAACAGVFGHEIGVGESSRSPRAGSIAARAGVHAATPVSTVIPLTTSGLHCGTICPATADDQPVIPLTTSGLHCGLAGQAEIRDCNLWSSRSPRAGSIAARPTFLQHVISSRHPAHHERAPLRRCIRAHGSVRPGESSRSPRAGSIAAPAARGGRAVRPAVIPLTTSGLHCGLFWPRVDLSPRWQVIPLTTSGLHCGGSSADVTRSTLPGHPAHHERAPLRRSLITPYFATSGGHPAHHERAPLRPNSASRRGNASSTVIPLTTSGLHCGPGRRRYAP